MFRRVLLELLSSKKAVATLAGVLVAIAAKVGIGLEPDAVAAIVSPILAYILGLGIADHGKEAERLRRNA